MILDQTMAKQLCYNILHEEPLRSHFIIVGDTTNLQWKRGKTPLSMWVNKNK